MYSSSYPSGCQSEANYRLVKAHKQGYPIRPVISMINTTQYNLAKFLDTVIKPVIPSAHMLNSTSEFLSKLDNADLGKAKLVSYDEESLFSNAPLAEVIDIACI